MFINRSSRRRRWVRKFEALEDRRLLANYNVTTTADVVDPNDGKLSLREAIDLANAHPGADVIVLKAGPHDSYKITIAGANEDANATGDFDIIDDLTIKSAGSGYPTISGNGLDRVFDVAGSLSFTLNHVIVTGGIARGYGGAIEAFDGDTLNILNTTIKNNISTSPGGGFGGGIYMDNGTLNLTNSHVDNNSAAAGVQGEGGGIFMSASDGGFNINKSTVNNNSAYGGGGGIYVEGIDLFSITASQVNNNHSGDEGGGGVLISSRITTISGDTISGNTTSGEGGALRSSSNRLIFINSNISNNSAAGDGGAATLDGGELIATNSTLANNTSGGAGGALANTAHMELTGITFNHNVAQGAGGAIYQGGSDDIDITKSTFTRNASLTDVGGAIAANGGSSTISVKDSKFTFNSSLESGGAINANGDTVTVLRSTFDHNSVGDGNGGAIDMGTIAAHFDFTDSTFTYNTSKADGGAFNSEGGDIELTRCVVRCNTATNGMGGGFADEGTSSSTITVTDSTIDGNTAGGNGGGFTATGSTLTMTGSTVSNNRSGSEGGGMYVLTLDDTEITNCTISGNGAAVDGGGVAVPFGAQHVVRFINDTIAFNASATGGGIFNDAPGSTDIVHLGNTIVAKNVATNGPDVFGAAWNDEGHNLFFSLLGSSNLGSAPGDIVGQDPRLGPLANNGGLTKTHALLKGSPAINAGDDSIAPPTDQRGVKRPQGPHVDIGALRKEIIRTPTIYPYQANTMSKKRSVRLRGRWARKFEVLEDRRLLTTYHVTTTADLVNPLDGKLSLREAIDLANAHPGADTIVLKAGPNAYKITIAGGGEDNNATGDFDILDDLTIKSAGSGFPTVGGNRLDRVFNIPAGFDGVDLTLNCSVENK